MSIKKHTYCTQPHKQSNRTHKTQGKKVVVSIIALSVAFGVQAADNVSLEQRVEQLEKQVAALQVLVNQQTDASSSAASAQQFAEFDLQAFEALPETEPNNPGLLVDVMAQNTTTLPLLPAGVSIANIKYQGNGVLGFRSILDQVKGDVPHPVGLYYQGYLSFPTTGEYVLAHSYISNGGNVVQRLATKGYCKSTLLLNGKQVSHTEGELDNANIDSNQIVISREQGHHPFGLWLICHGTGEKVALNAVYNYVGTKLSIRGPNDNEMKVIEAGAFSH